MMSRNPQTGGREYCHGYGEDFKREGVKDFHFYTLNRAEMSYAFAIRWVFDLVYK